MSFQSMLRAEPVGFIGLVDALRIRAGAWRIRLISAKLGVSAVPNTPRLLNASAKPDSMPKVRIPMPVLGLDNVHDPRDTVFQIGGPQSPPPRLVSATNVDIADDGEITRRPPVALTETLPGCIGTWTLGEREWAQDADTLWELTDTGREARVTGLVRRVAMTAHGGLIYVTDGATNWEIDGATVRTWGLPVPVAVVAEAVTGTPLVAGRYLVQIALVDDAGNSGGVSALVSVTADGETAYTASWAGAGDSESGWPVDTPAVAIDVYTSGPDQRETTWVARVPLDELPYSLPASPVTVADPPVTALMSGPPSGLLGLVSWRAFVLGWYDNVLAFSEGLEPHLWHADAFHQFSADVRAVAALTQGLWVATADGLVWVSGDDALTVVPNYRRRGVFRAGSAVIEGSRLPMLQTGGLVALFCDGDGVVAGLESGEAVPLTAGRYKPPAGARVSFAYTERDGFRQILMGVHEA